MTLSRQLLLSAMLIFLCLFAGMMFYVINNTQTFIDYQLAKHAKDTATSLGLSLSLAMDGNEIDLPTANRIIDAVWDSGYYQKITVVNVDDKVEVERKLKVKVYKVPDWFIQQLNLKTREERAKIQSGWLQKGEIIVQSNPGFAYEQIWNTLMDFLNWLLITALIAMALGSGILFIILRPLRAVTRQANAICNQQFVEETLPWTIDLRQVVEAMNNMSRRLKRLFEDQAAAAEELREQAYINPVTKLANRRYFDIHFDHLLADDETHGGVGLLIEVRDFKSYNDKHGYEAGDDLLRQVANQLQLQSAAIENALIAHLGGASFIIIMQAKLIEFGQELAHHLCTAFKEFHGRGLSKELDVAHIGVAAYQTKEGKKTILSKLDMALRHAQNQEPNSAYVLREMESSQVHGAQDWAKIFDAVVEQSQLTLVFQKVKLFDEESVFFEALMRIRWEGELLTAGMFMPMAERLNRIIELDKAMITTLFLQISTRNDKNCYFANISPTSIHNDQFTDWLLEKIKNLGKKATQVIIEVPEYGVITHVEKVRTLFFNANKLGAKTSIEHYGKNLSSFAYLSNMRLNYLKIDGSFIRNIHTHTEHQFLVKSLLEIARSLDVLVIAEAVEVEQEYDMLIALKVDGVQGYYIGKPAEQIS